MILALVIESCLGQTNYAFLRSAHRLLVTADFVPSSPILVTLIMEALRATEKSVLTRVTRLTAENDFL
jgi:hypothetical protein